jgi:hypothetical protein
MNICEHMWTYIYIYEHIYGCIFAFVCMQLYLYIYIHIYNCIHTGSVSRDTMVSPPQKVIAPRSSTPSLELVPLGQLKDLGSYIDSAKIHVDTFDETKVTQFLYRYGFIIPYYH